MRTVTDNRAVSALFRVCGGRGWRLQGDAVRRLAGRGAHVGEVQVFAVLVPLVVATVVCERLAHWLGPWWALAVLPVAWIVVVQVATIVLGLVAGAISLVAGAREVWRWRVWLVALGAWAWWAWQADTWIRWVAGAWLAVVGLEVAAQLILGWWRMMEVPGRGGIAVRCLLGVLVHGPLLVFVLRGEWPWALGSGVLVVAGFCWSTLTANARGFGPVVARCDGSGVWLTIDDGPDPATTPGLLDRLDAYGAKATFFVIGGRVEAHPELAREIVRRGHELGNHTQHHPAGSFWCAGPARTRREITGGAAAIERVTGVRPRWFRAPAGHRNYFTHPVTAAAGMQVVGWTRRGFDGISRKVPRILARLTRRLERGDIILLHDATPVAHEVLEGVLEALRARGLAARIPEE
jgi:peptidoglycan/xylan/chitin deacetylase (PgdA/CDA1 family)